MYRECRASPDAGHTVWWMLICRAVESAVIAALAARGGELPEMPSARFTNGKRDLYDAAEMQQYARDHAAAIAARDETDAMKRRDALRALAEIERDMGLDYTQPPKETK
ncbi:MAG: hypothetical protein RJA99_4260 [Pseudomonadota bacterium]|jgi:hypothetical protein